MNFEQLTEFCVAAKFRNITKAAEYLYLSQSTLSRHIFDLESNLNVQLVRRDNRSFELTKAGEVFYKDIIKILEQLESVKLNVQRISQGHVGKLNIGSFSPYIPYVFEKMLSFRKRHPEITCFIRQNPNAVVDSVLTGEIDIGLVFSFEMPPCRDLNSLTVARDDLCLIVPSNHRLAASSTVALSTIQNETLLILSPKNFELLMQAVEIIVHKEMPKNNKVMEEENVENMILHTRFGDGISLLPRIMAQEIAGGCVLLGITDYNTNYDICLCWREDNNNPALRQFLTYFDM